MDEQQKSVDEILCARDEGEDGHVVAPRDAELDYDLFNMSATDPNPIDMGELKFRQEHFLNDLARDNCQLLCNRLMQLPQKMDEDVRYYILPTKPSFLLPREKPCPKPRAETRWERFAKLKSIQNKKKTRMVFDEASGEYRPRWGYKRANDVGNDWVLEVPDHADPYEDQFEKKTKSKRDSVARNEFQRLRNIAKAAKVKAPESMATSDQPDRKRLRVSSSIASKSSASLGKFDPNVKGEKPGPRGKKQKFAPNLQPIKEENKHMLAILKDVGKKPSIIDAKQAPGFDKKAEKMVRIEERKQAEYASKKKRGGRKQRPNEGGKFNKALSSGGVKKKTKQPVGKTNRRKNKSGVKK